MINKSVIIVFTSVIHFLREIVTILFIVSVIGDKVFPAESPEDQFVSGVKRTLVSAADDRPSSEKHYACATYEVDLTDREAYATVLWQLNVKRVEKNE